MEKIRHRQLHHRVIDYTILALVVATGFTAIIGSGGQPLKQLQLATVTAVAYCVWGIFHHISEGDLNWKVMVEYVGIAFLAVAILWTLVSYIL